MVGSNPIGSTNYYLPLTAYCPFLAPKVLALFVNARISGALPSSACIAGIQYWMYDYP